MAPLTCSRELQRPRSGPARCCERPILTAAGQLVARHPFIACGRTLQVSDAVNLSGLDCHASSSE